MRLLIKSLFAEKIKYTNVLDCFYQNYQFVKVDPPRFVKKRIGKPLYPYQRVVTLNKVILRCSRQKRMRNPENYSRVPSLKRYL